MSLYNEAGSQINNTSKYKFLPPIKKTNNEIDDDDFDIADATPIFSKRKLHLRLPANYAPEYTHITISKNWLICLMESQKNSTTFMRFFLPRAIPPGEICLDKYLAGYKIHKLFLDHSGHHTLVSLVPTSQGLSADFLYIHGNGPKVRRIEKFKDHEITAVAFNQYMGTESSTGAILLGTSKGLIFETELHQDADKPLYKKQVYDLGLGRPKYAIHNLQILRLNHVNRYAVIANSFEGIYTFLDQLKPEEKSFQNIFASYVNGARIPQAIEEKTDLNFSIFNFYAEPNSKMPSNWAWFCGQGVKLGTFNTSESSETFRDEPVLKCLEESISLDFEQFKHLSIEQRRLHVPKAIAVTQHHVLLMYADHITGISTLNREIVYEEYFNAQFGELLNIFRDYFTGTIYAYTSKTIFSFVITEEDRHVWRIYLNKGLYEMAEVYATGNAENLDQIWTKKADAEFEAKNFIEAAHTYSRTLRPFEEVSLKLIELEDKHPLILYAKLRIANTPEYAQDQLNVLVCWLVDMYLIQINMPGISEQLRNEWQAEYDRFMRDPKVVKIASMPENKENIHGLLKDHDDNHNLAQFAIANGDFDEVINQKINGGKYEEALLTMKQQRSDELFYKYAPKLAEHLPCETIKTLMEQERKFDIDKLLPTLLCVETPKYVDEIIKYLEHVIYNLNETEQMVHDFLLRLYAKHKPAKVISYLQNEGTDITMVHYNVNCALLNCIQADLKDACVFLNCLLEMWPSAVELAMTYNMNLAKQTASRANNEQTKRQLWLRIAQHEIKGTNDVKKALDLLRECNLLRIEDLLPFFSDFEKIDDFKEPICEALKEYNKKIQELQHEMQECTKQSDRVRADLQNLRKGSVRIQANETCAICDTLLMVKPFYLFACGHKFHADCLEKQVIPTMSSDASRKLTLLKQQLESLLTQSIVKTDSIEQQRKRQQLKKEIEELVATDCWFCYHMIDKIDKPFVDDWEQVNIDWE